MPLLPAGAPPLRVLHLSDLHMTPGQARKQAWLRDLATAAARPGRRHRRQPGPPRRGGAACSTAYDGLLDVPGVFVFGSNDYFAPILKNPLRYLLPDDGRRNTGVAQLPWPDLADALAERGLARPDQPAAHARRSAALRIAFAGVDDPHLGYDRLDLVAGPADRTADLRLAVTHAPYLRVLDQFAADGYDAIIAGHTHGGQVCLPGRRRADHQLRPRPARAKGLHRHPADSAPGDPGSSWLHVSAGLGTSPYARIRVACRPEATLATLVPLR